MTANEAVSKAARRILDAAALGRELAPFTEADPGFDLDHAYAVSEAVEAHRSGSGERPIGWKIGFTNRTIWDEYGVHAPIWGAMYDTTVGEVAAGPDPVDCSLAGLAEPRIEPEIVFRLAARPEPGMDEDSLAACIGGVAHGFEIVQSIYPGWRFAAADTVAAFALHGLMRHGPFTDLSGRGDFRPSMEAFSISLYRSGQRIDRGDGAAVLGGPLSALRHFIEGQAARPAARRPGPGDIITTGTVTRAFAIRPGEVWSSRVDGLDLPGLTLAFVP